MKSKSEDIDDDPLDDVIDFSKSRPNPYWLGMVDRHRVRLLDKDVADAFPDNAAVNEALRTVMRLTPVLRKRSARTATAPKTAAKKKARS
jgi:hypothetical protein